MFSITTKKEYWTWLESGVAPVGKGSLKDIQDALILYFLKDVRDARILELGGGISRVLPTLAKHSECWNVDKFEGLGGGPVRTQETAGIRIVKEYMGAFSKELPDDYFDYVISISAVEHIPPNLYADAMKDCLRVLRPGSVMIHAIDVYLLDRIDQHPHGAKNQIRMKMYRSTPEILGNKVEWLEPLAVGDDITANSSIAANSPDTMYQWNKSAPSLRDLREIAISCNLTMGLRKRA